MTLKTVPVRVVALCPDNTPAARATITAQLVDAQGRKAVPSFDGDVVAPVLLSVDADDNGSALLHLWPNERGTVPTAYRVVAKMGAQEVMNITIAVPDADPANEIPIGQLRDQAVWPALDPAQQASRDAQAAAQHANDDALATAADRVQVQQDRLLADASAQQGNGFMLTAVASAAAASLFALAAASVAQQDLSGVIGGALHRSPNAVVAQTIYQTREDSDGGAWTGKVDASYLYETLNGPWIPHADASGFQSELAARCMGGSLGPELLPNATDAAQWLPNGGTISTVGGKLRVTSGGTISAATRAITTVVGQVYVLLARRVTDNTASGNTYQGLLRAGNAAGAATLLNQVINSVPGVSAIGVFTATATTTYVSAAINSGVLGTYVDFDSIHCYAVNAFAPSGSFYPDATTGKFYRLLKNLWPLTNKAGNFASGPAQFTENAFGSMLKLAAGSTGSNITAQYGLRNFNATAGGVQGARYSLQLKARQAEMPRIGVRGFFDGTAYAFHFLVDLTNGTVVNSSGTVAPTVTPHPDGDGSYLIKIENFKGWNGDILVEAHSAAATAAQQNDTYIAGQGVYVGNIQLELGTACTSEEDNPNTTTQTETFRGNKARFPKISLPIPEAARVVLYDALEPGRPMWKVFVGGANNALRANTNSITSVAAIGACVMIGCSNGGLSLFDFANDRAYNWSSVGLSRYNGTLAQCNAGLGWTVIDSTKTLPGSVANCVAACTEPTAPVDPATGLQSPSIAVGTNAGLTMILPDGSVVSPTSLSGAAMMSVAINPYTVVCGSGSGNLYAPTTPTRPSAMVTGTGFTTIRTPIPQLGASGNVDRLVLKDRGVILRHSTAGAQNTVELIRYNEVNPASSLVAQIAPTYITGLLSGSPVRVLFSDVTAGAASGAEQLQDPGFDTGTGWTLGNTGAGPVATISGGLFSSVRDAPGTTVGTGVTSYATTPGKVYQAVLSGCSGGTINIRVGTASMIGDITANSIAVGAQPVIVTFTAVGATTFVSVFNASNGTTATLDGCSVKEVVSDRSYKGKNATIFGTLTKTAVASAAQLVFWGGFSATNYAQEAYSADYDYGTGGFAIPAWMQIPSVVQPGGGFSMQNVPWQPTAQQSACFPDASAELLTNGSPMAAAGWTVEAAGWSFAGGAATHTPGNTGRLYQTGLASASLWRVIVTVSGMTAGTLQVGGNTVQNAATIISANGTYTFFIAPNGGILYLSPSSSFDGSVTSASVKEVGPSVLMDRSAAGGGAGWQFGVDAMGRVVFTVTDSAAATRTVKSTTFYGGNPGISVEASLSTSGTLTMKVNGEVQGQTTGAPLASMSNASAVVTWGNSRALNAAFIGLCNLVKPTATVPSDDASRWIYQQERAMFRDGAQVTLPDSGALVDMDYDPTEDKWKVASAANESTFVGLVRTGSAPAPAGSLTRVAHKGGIKLLARSTTNPGVDVTIPPQNLQEQLQRRGEEAARRNVPVQALDWAGGFQGIVASGSTAINTSSGISLPVGATMLGAQISGTGVPAGATIQGVSGVTEYMSAPGTVNANPTQISFLDFILPTGMEAFEVCASGALKQEGATKDYQRLFDGFRERVRFGTAPGNTAHVRVNARRMA